MTVTLAEARRRADPASPWLTIYCADTGAPLGCWPAAVIGGRQGRAGGHEPIVTWVRHDGTMWTGGAARRRLVLVNHPTAAVAHWALRLP